VTQVRCGRCQTQFAVQGPGRYPCPQCGTVNEVRPAGDVFRSNPTSLPEQASPRLTCSDCGFSFIVGDIDVAMCPNCGSTVDTGGGV
jgi:Zn finger protein HypA/HybF involved in hydrogenase expression